MFDTIYIENSINLHPRTIELLERFPNASTITCNRYTEIFNRKAQNFRLQKHKPSLILAEKFDNYVLETPAGYGIGSENNFYFSHMLNCIYDCRYCFLQGMYRSAHYVLFVNYEQFEAALLDKINTNTGQAAHFFSGYDCDSLALDPITHFTDFFLPVFRRNPGALLELRTKSTQIRSLLELETFENCVIAFSFTPENVAAALEHKTPTPQRRIKAMQQLQSHGWLLGLRFDPLIYHEDFRCHYRQLFQDIFTQLDSDRIHSVSLGNFRLPNSFFRTITRLYPEEVLFASPFEESDGMITYKEKIRNEMLNFCYDELLLYIQEDKFFPCEKIIR